jgi:hypothetical protein
MMYIKRLTKIIGAYQYSDNAIIFINNLFINVYYFDEITAIYN